MREREREKKRASMMRLGGREESVKNNKYVNKYARDNDSWNLSGNIFNLIILSERKSISIHQVFNEKKKNKKKRFLRLK